MSLSLFPSGCDDKSNFRNGRSAAAWLARRDYHAQRSRTIRHCRGNVREDASMRCMPGSGIWNVSSPVGEIRASEGLGRKRSIRRDSQDHVPSNSLARSVQRDIPPSKHNFVHGRRICQRFSGTTGSLIPLFSASAPLRKRIPNNGDIRIRSKIAGDERLHLDYLLKRGTLDSAQFLRRKRVNKRQRNPGNCKRACKTNQIVPPVETFIADPILAVVRNITQN